MAENAELANLKTYSRFADDQVLPALYTHLPPDLCNSVKIYIAIRGAGHQTIDNFFADLRKYWVECQLPENVVNSNNASIFDSYLNQELEKRLEVIEINLAKLTKLIREDTKSA
ncbi:7399_t:CDS:2 [Funneliformis geosporum]|uniref:7399_t:CDS:1 n=1 Tax=Funneliformis geosporum TaxID=1117311 RepID=A0A9W4SU26_9GLOM|nr:7399_t:CDS:2 [Funneliformis geosporum]